RVGVAVAQAVTQLDDLALSIRERLEDLLDLVLEHFLRGGTDGRFGAVVLDEIAKITVFTFADRPGQADRMAADLHHPPGLVDTDARRFGRLLDGRLASHLLQELFGDVAQLAHRLDHVDGDADGAGLVGDGPRDGLPNPPGRIGAE